MSHRPGKDHTRHRTAKADGSHAVRSHTALRCAGLAAALLLAGCLLAMKERRDDAKLPQVHGQVVSLDLACGYYSGHRRSTGCKWFPSVRFVTLEGRAITFRSNVGQWQPAFEQGQGLQVRYDPRSGDVRASAFIVDYGWRYSSFLYRLAVVAAAVACLLALVDRKRSGPGAT